MYHDASSTDVQERYAGLLGDFERRALLFPVTVVDGVPVYDGAVSYPAIMRAVQNTLLERESKTEA